MHTDAHVRSLACRRSNLEQLREHLHHHTVRYGSGRRAVSVLSFGENARKWRDVVKRLGTVPASVE